MSIPIEVKVNMENDELYCEFCKRKICLGEKFIIVIQNDDNEIIESPRHLDCIEETYDEDNY